MDDERALCARCGALQELGLVAGASLDEVKAAYKMLVKVWHPDRFQSDQKLARSAEAKLKAINTAYSNLSAEGYKGGIGNKGDRGNKGGASQGAQVRDRDQDSGPGAGLWGFGQADYDFRAPHRRTPGTEAASKTGKTASVAAEQDYGDNCWLQARLPPAGAWCCAGSRVVLVWDCRLLRGRRPDDGQILSGNQVAAQN